MICYIRNVKTLWLVTVPKNVVNFGLIYKWLFGLARTLQIFYQNYMHVLVGHKNHIHQ